MSLVLRLHSLGVKPQATLEIRGEGGEVVFPSPAEADVTLHEPSQPRCPIRQCVFNLSSELGAMQN